MCFLKISCPFWKAVINIWNFSDFKYLSLRPSSYRNIFFDDNFYRTLSVYYPQYWCNIILYVSPVLWYCREKRLETFRVTVFQLRWCVPSVLFMSPAICQHPRNLECNNFSGNRPLWIIVTHPVAVTHFSEHLYIHTHTRGTVALYIYII